MRTTALGIACLLSMTLLVGCGQPPAAAPAKSDTPAKSDSPAKPAETVSAAPAATPAAAPAAQPAATQPAPQPAAQPAAAAAPSGPAPFWPVFHGPKNDNISPDTGLLKEWPKDGPKLIWTAKNLGEGYASVTTADGLIYTAGNADGKTFVIALDLTGKEVWRVSVGDAYKGSYPGVRSTPTLDGQLLYYETPLGDLVCLESKTGKQVWSMNILKDFEAKQIQWALAESPLVDGDRLICCPIGRKASVVALDKKTGKVVWLGKAVDGNAGYATPLIMAQQGLRMVLTMTSNALIGVNADNGELLFSYTHETKYEVNATTPIYRDGQIFITSGYGSGSEMLKLTVDGKKAKVEKLWSNKDLDNHHGGLVLLDGTIYGASQDGARGKWVAVDWKSGRTAYAEKGVGKGSLTCAEGMLYTMNEKRKLGLVPATPKEHKVVSQFDLPSGGQGASWAHPVVIGGRLYVRYDQFLYVYDVRGK